MISFFGRFVLFSLATYAVCQAVLLISQTNSLGTAVTPIVFAISVTCGFFFALISRREKSAKVSDTRRPRVDSARIGMQYLACQTDAEKDRYYSGPKARR
ncbi:MAG: hypothetical protein WA771_02915 [Chthoniobacterales bacterium]